MAKGLVSYTNLTAIANAIRTKNGSSDRYTPATMAQAISDIPTSQVDQESALQWMLNNKTNYAGIAAGLTTLTTLPTFTQPTGVTDFTSAFSGCSALTDISSVDLTSSTKLQSICDGCENLVSNNITVNFPSAEMSLDYAFRNCAKVKKVSQVGQDQMAFRRITSAREAFYGCSVLTSFSYNNYIRAGYCKDFRSMFQNCASLVSVIITEMGNGGPNSYLQQDANSSSMFSGCSGLSTVTFNSGTDCLKYLTVCVSMFENCVKVKKIQIPTGNNFRPRNIGSMFKGCSILTTATGIDFSMMENGNSAFYGCGALTTLPSTIDFSSASGTGLQRMFTNCSALSNTSLDAILGGLVTATRIVANKNLKYIGLSSSQATTCTTLSNWAACQAAGWTTGY